MEAIQRPLRKLANYYVNQIKWNGFFRGSWLFLRLAGFKILNIAINYNALYLYRKDTSGPEASPMLARDIRFEEATAADYEAIIKLNPARPAGFIRERLGNNETCYVARSPDDDFCAYFWVAPGKRVFNYRAKEILIDDDDVYIRDGLTLPRYRGLGIMTMFLEWIGHELWQKNKKTMWGAVKYWNFSSQRSNYKAGFRIGEKIHFLRLPFTKRDFSFSSKRRAR